MSFSAKQQEFFNNANHRWNIKSGATRSGKTYMDYFVIPKRLQRIRGKEGLRVILGNTQGTLDRNIIKPLQELWGHSLVSDINSNNISTMFGDQVYCIGADKINSVNRIRGSSWAYLYGDEVATWHPEVFTMAKSRLDKSYSKADLTCNPEFPTHFVKKFIDSDADIYCQNYTIDDNPFLDPVFVDNLKREYYGTVYYDRYILGRWVQAEGRVYKTLTDRNIISEIPGRIYRANLSVDFGGNKSATAFACVGWYINEQKQKCIVLLDEFYDKENKSVESVLANWKRFVDKQRSQWPLDRAFGDSAEQLIIKSMREQPGGIYVDNAAKKPITDRIRLFDILFSQGRASLMAHCKYTIDAFREAVYDDRSKEDARLDDGTSNIDSLDAIEYAVERDMTELIEGGG